MATIQDRVVEGTFASLTSTGVTAILFLVIGFSLEEYLKRLRRYPDEDKRRLKVEDVKDRGSEGWAMGYLYRARTYIPFAPTPDYSNVPLKWIWTAAMLPQSFFENHCGADCTVYVRFLRGCFYWTLLQAFTVFPILLSINFTYAASDIATTSIERASISSLTSSGAGEDLLWIHVCCLWFITFTWYATLTWISYGAIRIRRNVLRSLIRGETDSLPDMLENENKLINDGERELNGIKDEGGSQGNHRGGELNQSEEENLQVAEIGHRFKTILIRNIPIAMRSEEQLRVYFQYYLRGEGQLSNENNMEDIESTPRNSTSESPTTLPSTPNPLLSKSKSTSFDEDKRRNESEVTTDSSQFITNIVLARKQGELNELFVKYTDVLHRLETAHCVLASNVMKYVTEKVKEENDEILGNSKLNSSNKFNWRKFSSLFKFKPKAIDPEVARVNKEQDQQLINTLRSFIPSPLYSTTSTSPSIWIALRSLSPQLLDRFQPLYKLKRFRGQSVPSIDYYLTKLNLLTSLIEDKRSRPLETEAGSSAFVTFGSALDARRARKELNVRPGSGKKVSNQSKTDKRFGDVLVGKKALGLEMECKVGMAPEVRDLDWNRLVYVSLRSDIVRGFVLNVFIWAATIFWVIPITFLVGLLSLTSTNSPSIAKYIPQLATYLNSHKVTQSLFSNLLPAAIVALLSMLVPTLIGILTRNGQAFITVSKLHAQVQSRYYKWLIFNIVIVFCVGVSAFTSFLTAFQTPESLLKVIANSFPKGATFFVSWSLLVIGIHSGIEIALFGIPYINHATIRKLRSPRKRETEALPRSFSYFYWLPNNLLVLAVSCIFAILNPLVLAFNLAYFSFALVVFKSQFAHVYWRRWYENNGRLIVRRISRYSLDLFMVAQVVAVALFEFLKLYKLGASCIPLIILTAFLKLIGTRYFDKLMDEIDEAEIDIVCGGNSVIPDLSVPLTEKDVDMHHLPISEAFSTISTFATVTLPALTFRPKQRLPSISSPNSTADKIRPRSESQPLPPSRLNPHQRFLTSTLGIDSNNLGQYSIVEKEEDELNSSKSEKLIRESKPKIIFTPLPRSPMNLSAIVTSQPLTTSIITPHPPIVRDDRPVTNLKYDNPAVVVPLNRSLWLPADPLVPLDLGDTIDYHGTALVSSEGGRGLIGSWDEFLTEDIEDEEEEISRFGIAEYEAGMAILGAARVRTKRSDSAATIEEIIQNRMNRSASSPLAVRIRVAEDVASNVEAEEVAKSFGAPSMLRRNTGTSSIESVSFFPPMMRRRGTGASSNLIIDTTVGTYSPTSKASPAILSASSDPLAVVKHPFGIKPSAPRIPSFTTTTASPTEYTTTDSISPDLNSLNSLPPPITSNLPVESNSLSSQIASTPIHTPRIASDYSNLSSYPPASSSSNTIRPARPARISSNHTPTNSTLGPVNQGSSISQIAALREELWAEHRDESKKRKEKESKRSEEEKNEKKGGWFSKYVLGEVEEAEAGPGTSHDD